MVDEANRSKNSDIEALREYIRLLEKVQKQIWSAGMSPAEHIVLDTLERRGQLAGANRRRAGRAFRSSPSACGLAA